MQKKLLLVPFFKHYSSSSSMVLKIHKIEIIKAINIKICQLTEKFLQKTVLIRQNTKKRPKSYDS